jgi:hypothetical protein
VRSGRLNRKGGQLLAMAPKRLGEYLTSVGKKGWNVYNCNSPSLNIRRFVPVVNLARLGFPMKDAAIRTIYEKVLVEKSITDEEWDLLNAAVFPRT